MKKKNKMTKEEMAEYKTSDEYKYKKYRNTSYGFFAGSWLSALLPEGILLGINWNDWIVTQEDNVKVSVALVLTVLISIFLIYKKAKDQIKFSYLGIVIGFWVVTGLCYLFSALFTQIVIIMVCASIGLTASLALEIPAEYYKEKKEEYREVEGRAENQLIKAIKKIAMGKNKDKDSDKGAPTE